MPGAVAAYFGYIAGSLLLRGRWRIDPQLKTMRDVARYLIVMLACAVERAGGDGCFDGRRSGGRRTLPEKSDGLVGERRDRDRHIHSTAAGPYHGENRLTTRQGSREARFV